MKKIILFFIRIYQTVFSFETGIPHLLFPWIKICRFTPTCSSYTYQAVERYGILYGSILGVKRILRCHPWSAGGRDEVPVKKMKFRYFVTSLVRKKR